MARGKQGQAGLDGLQANHCGAGAWGSSFAPLAGRKIILPRALTSWVLVARMNLY